ncbi:Rhodanese-like domain-containing protein [Tricladium varicosporioides]|nr:Rhodanese-like domain-containing protein [Hymenoscyphus varicosporioides]
MSSATRISIATLPRISPTNLSQILLAASNPTNSSNLDTHTAPNNIAIVDVRDDDHIGGHIRYSHHQPSSTLDTHMPTLVRKFKDKEIVVFHCALSQQRGPSAALKYLRERERLVGPNKETEGEDESGEGKGAMEQKVYVLDRGFVGWQEVYGEDSRLTEGYRKEIWKEGYWM